MNKSLVSAFGLVVALALTMPVIGATSADASQMRMPHHHHHHHRVRHHHWHHRHWSHHHWHHHHHHHVEKVVKKI